MLSGLCGCRGGVGADYRDVAQLQLVQTIGVDREDDGSIVMSISSGKAPEGAARTLMSRPGPSVATAMESLQDYAANEELFYAHAHHVLFGTDAAEKGIGEYLGYIQRDGSIRMGVYLFAVKNSGAQELISASTDPDYDISQVMEAILRDIHLRGDSHAFTCEETVRALSSGGAALICALTGKDASGSVYSADVPITPVADGFGILRGDRVVGYISPRDASAVCMLLGLDGSDELLLETSCGQITLSLTDFQSSISPVYSEDGRLERVELRCRVSGGLLELSRPIYELDRSFLDAAGEALAQDVMERISSVLEAVSRYEADFLGLGGILRSKSPEAFDRMPESFQDCLGRLSFHVEVTGRISNSYDTEGSVDYWGGGGNDRQN